MPILEAQQVTKAYGTAEAKVQVLRGITTQVASGELVAVMGPSGSGKSTLLTILGGIESPTTGRVLLEDVDLTVLTEDQRTKLRRRRIGFVFQSFNLLPNLNALENVALPLQLDGVASSIAYQRAQHTLDQVEMSHRLNHLPSAMSGGEQQRVAIARSLVIRPALLLMDEPTGNLDSRQSDRVSKLMRSLVDDLGQTIVMVTHDASIASIASRLICIRDGEIERDGTPAEILGRAHKMTRNA
ncbi:MAG: ABC transporter ATP-binding protein [Pirellulaceae bacterium]|nr:ABC transporter ATP-binding protein [Pirellulaceae bacterium]